MLDLSVICKYIIWCRYIGCSVCFSTKYGIPKPKGVFECHRNKTDNEKLALVYR